MLPIFSKQVKFFLCLENLHIREEIILSIFIDKVTQYFFIASHASSLILVPQTFISAKMAKIMLKSDQIVSNFTVSKRLKNISIFVLRHLNKVLKHKKLLQSIQYSSICCYLYANTLQTQISGLKFLLILNTYNYERKRIQKNIFSTTYT